MLELYLVKQKLSGEYLSGVKEAVEKELRAKSCAGKIAAGQKVAVTVGSRGISGLKEVVLALVDWLKSLGAEPVLIPAMGSHGGASPEGQLEVLAEYGITEENTGARVISSLEVVELGVTSTGAPVYVDKNAYECDAIILLNRVKPHTTMFGPVQSGLIKMAAVGLGKQKGAESMHSNLEVNVPDAFRIISSELTVIFGVALVENAFEQLQLVEVVPVEEIPEKEAQLLKTASENLPGIPFEPLDVLIIKRIGKNISGSGADTNVVGRWRRVGGAPDKTIKRLAFLDLTPGSHGNAVGVGMADVITSGLKEKIDLQATYANALTAGWFGGAKVPLTVKNGRELVETILQGFDPESVRLVFIKDTLHLERFYISKALLNETEKSSNLEVISGPHALTYDEQGDIKGFFED